jgi:gamma-glutamyltranspeptidase/glutathione hydrolase
MIRRLLFAPVLGLLCAAPLDAAVVAESKSGVVVAGAAEAAEAGAQILREGGTAADAAVAISLTLTVAEPFNSGIGGKLAGLYYDAATHKTWFIDGMGKAPLNVPVQEICQGPKEQRVRGYKSVCVPGTVGALELIHKRWGKLPWKACAQPAVKLAEDGFRVPAKQLFVFKDCMNVVKPDAEAMKIYFPGDQVPAEGTLLANPDLAKVMTALRDEGPGVFYKGWIADKIVEASRNGGGWMEKKDFEDYRPEVSEPLAIDYHDHKIATSPPPLTGGAIIASVLKVLEDTAPAPPGANSAPRIDSAARAFRTVYPRVASVAGDHPQSRGDVEHLLSHSEIAALRKQMAGGDSGEAKPFESDGGETSHFIVVDKAGNIACITQSLSLHFGAAVVPPGTGILLNNDMSNFGYYTPTSINYVAPGKKPRSTITPAIVFDKSGKPVVALGAPGGQRIPSGVYQVLTGFLDYKQALPEAVDSPRFHLVRPTTSKDPRNTLEIETGADDAVSSELEKDGWAVQHKRRESYHFAGVNGVAFRPDGTRVAVGDDRRSNQAVAQ